MLCNMVLTTHPNSVLNLHLRHSCMFAYSQTGRTFMFTLLLPITKASLSPVSMTMFSFWGTVCQIALQTNWYKSDFKTLSPCMVSIQLLMCCLQFLRWKQQTINDGYMTTCPAFGYLRVTKDRGAQMKNEWRDWGLSTTKFLLSHFCPRRQFHNYSLVKPDSCFLYESLAL